MSFASARVTRGKGTVGTATGRPKLRSISSPCSSATRASVCASHCSSKTITSSWESIQEISTSTLVNSVSWREVKEGLARNTGPISNTRPKPAAIAICL